MAFTGLATPSLALILRGNDAEPVRRAIEDARRASDV